MSLNVFYINIYVHVVYAPKHQSKCENLLCNKADSDADSKDATELHDGKCRVNGGV